MFDLEKSITEWRRQMLAAGIASPVPLEELEAHLREDIEHLVATGKPNEEAFGIARARIGNPGRMVAEFKRANHMTNIMKRKIGISLVAVTLLAGIVLQVIGSPVFAHVSKMTKQGGTVMVDNFWRIQWYAFVLAGLLVAGIVLAIVPSREKRSS